MRKRTEFENALRTKRHAVSVWMRYARWEEEQNELERARSIYERAIEIDYKNPAVWSKYGDMEVRHKNVNHARNIWDRAVQLLPRVNAFWYKFVLLEFRLANYAAVRRLYERWVEWEPDVQGWNSYLKFERQAGETERVRAIFAKYVRAHHLPPVWLKWAKFEEKQGAVDRARAVYEAAVDAFKDEPEQQAALFIAFAQFETRHKETDRARAIYKFALDRIPKAQARALFSEFIAFEKVHGDRDAIEHIIVGKRRFQYEEFLSADSRNYDLWFDYVRLEELHGDTERVREVYERALGSSVWPPMEKAAWKRYVYLWYNYALWEEITAKDFGRARQIYSTLIKILPHSRWTFVRAWTLYAHFELRQRNLDGARKIFGHALGVAPSERLYATYIELELQLGNVDRCRLLYEKWLQWRPDACKAWTKMADLEASLQEDERARGIYELAIAQPELDTPELVWKAYIDFETGRGQAERARDLFRRLLERTKHVRVWISLGLFEVQLGRLTAARRVFQEAFEALKAPELAEQRVMLVEAWRNFEQEHGNEETQQAVRRHLPQRVKKRRALGEQGFEEFYEYVFPDQQEARAGLKLLEAAKKWKKEAAQGAPQ